MTEREEINALRRELAATRIENARFRRTMEDLLYNLEAENMPTVDERISASEKKISLVVGEEGGVRGSVLVEAINGSSGVSIAADRINLNGAVTANENFRIYEDGSVSCREMEITGGHISLPDDGTGKAIIEVYSNDLGGAITVYANRISIEGEPIPGAYLQSSDFGCERVGFHREVTAGDGCVTVRDTSLSAEALVCRTTRKQGDTLLSEEQVRLSPTELAHPYIYKNPVSSTEGLRPLYIDENGKIRAFYG